MLLASTFNQRVHHAPIFEDYLGEAVDVAVFQNELYGGTTAVTSNSSSSNWKELTSAAVE